MDDQVLDITKLTMPRTRTARLVTEISELSLLRGRDIDTFLLTLLGNFKKWQEDASGFPAYFFQDINVANKLYIIGTWRSIEAHADFLRRGRPGGLLFGMWPRRRGRGRKPLSLLRPFCEKNPHTVMHVANLEGAGGVGYLDGHNVGVIIGEADEESAGERYFESWVTPEFEGAYKQFQGMKIEEAKGKVTYVSIKGLEPVEIDDIDPEEWKDLLSQCKPGEWKWFIGERIPVPAVFPD